MRRLRAGERLLRAENRAMIREQHQIKRFAPLTLAERFDREIDDLYASLVALDRNPLACRRPAGFHRFAKQRSQIEPQSLAGHRQELACRCPARRLEVFAGAGRIVDDIAVMIDHDMRR